MSTSKFKILKKYYTYLLMKKLSINFIGETIIKHTQPTAPKGSQCYLKHFYDKYKKYIPKNKLITCK